MTDRQISEIWIYPIKSLGGISVRSAVVRPKGLAWDRRWMLVDESNQFMTQRNLPQMALFKLTLADGRVQVTHRNESVSFPVTGDCSTLFEAAIWDDRVMVGEVSREVSQWFSEQLAMRCRLVSFPEENARPVDPKYRVAEDQVSLADGYPLLIIGQSSLDDLNMRLREPVLMNRFRPNLVFTGGAPYEEDEWKNFSAGTNRFAAVKRCARCVLTTVDPSTGEKGTEPLATLSKYRRVDSKVLFGQNLIALNYNEVSVGDKIVLE